MEQEEWIRSICRGGYFLLFTFFLGVGVFWVRFVYNGIKMRVNDSFWRAVPCRYVVYSSTSQSLTRT